MADSALFWSGNWGGAGGQHVCVCSAGVWLGVDRLTGKMERVCV
jgi:hypothetical protein